MGIIEFVFGGKKHKIQDYIKRNAIILDVRTQREWQKGHIKNAVHIPLNELRGRMDEIKQKSQPVIVYCKSGVRSYRASKFLKSNNIDATNGGGWQSLKNKL
ncbi:rhodanese-like domain-containing protein [uncultured Algibacter sp.]|uniref:rhodanese-like domain-containing protein n=1 Tax=uncultured Algibacter sp. TaxID=298659 RepID=UPI0032179175